MCEIILKCSNQESVIFQNADRVLVDKFDSGTEQSIFNVGTSGNGSVPIKEGRFYQFKAIVFLKDLVSYSKLYFSMLGDKEMTDDIAYIANSRLIYDPSVDGNPVAIDAYSFSKTCINNEDENVGNGFFKVEGSFRAIGNGFLIPAISFDGMTSEDKVLCGSRFSLKEIATTADIV
jgi:hypothetical protein